MKRSIQLSILIGMLAIFALILGIALRVLHSTASSTDLAVKRVSEFYLKELAGRRAQVITSQIETKIDQMQRAMQVITGEDLESEDKLRTFIGKIETLYALELFALVDEDDIVYSRYSTYMGGSRYGFLAQDLADNGPVISTVHLYGGKKHICIAIPLQGLIFKGKNLEVCFVEMDIDSLAETLAFDAENTGTWFGLYYRNGENLTRMDFGPFDAGQNLLKASEDMLDEKEWTALNENFQNEQQGETVFSIHSDHDTLYYLPVPDTGWMMTVLISGNLIQDQVRGISDQLLRQGTQYFILICAALVIFFLVLFAQLRRRSSDLLERERENSREISERAERSESELGVYKRVANKDPLTGVQSKFAYLEKTKELAQAMEDGTIGGLAILVCDLNGLKHINDTLGHAAGDEYLKKGAMMLCRIYQHSPVYRIGGDEFVVILQNSDFERRIDLMDGLNRQVEANIGSNEVVISVGMAEYTPDDRSIEEVFGRADHLMYVRKAQLKKMDEEHRG